MNWRCESETYGFSLALTLPSWAILKPGGSMQDEKFSELEGRASRIGELDEIKNLEARARVHRQIEQMKAEGKAFELSAEEEELLRAFRRFKLRMRKDGEVFTWQTSRPEGVQIVEETAQILHPNEAAD
jgi:hypothetical protein